MSIRIASGVRLSIDKSLNQFKLICSKYGRQLGTEKAIEEYRHDFEVCLTFANLKAIGIEFFTPDQVVVVSLWITFDPGTGKAVDGQNKNGLEPTFAPRALIAGHRILKRDRDRDAETVYRHLLKGSWSTAGGFAKASGESYGSRHCEAISGGWAQGEFFAAELLRHRGVIRRVSPCGRFCFARDEAEMRDVFLHVNDLATSNGFKFERGCRVSYFIATTRRGWAGRIIHPV